jgi:Pyoverdine/dityrosine biosynthesis protein
VSLAPPWVAEALALPPTKSTPLCPLDDPAPPDAAARGPASASRRALSISHARSLRALPLDLLHTSNGMDQWPIHLNSRELATLLDALRSSSAAASARLADNALTHLTTTTDRATGSSPSRHPNDVVTVVTGLHRILTRSRFLKGSRSCFPLETAIAQMAPFIQAQQPVTILTSGFPFKQHDNRLKAAGPSPDLAELGALLRLKELHGAFAALYPPALRVVVLNDGGYSRPRGWAEMRRYRGQLKRYAQLVGLGNSVQFRDQSCFVARLLGPQRWCMRERYRRRFRERISALAGSPCSLADAAQINQRLAGALPLLLLAGVPPFHAILSSLVYSVPVPTRPGIDPRRWACEVLARPDGYTEPGLSPDLVSARQQVITSAWQDAVNYLASCLADAAVGVARRFPLHVRLATVASRPGCSGFSYLGGSTLLPWHGTGCLDGRGLLCAEFLASLEDRSFRPVYSDLIGDTQPLLMVPSARTVYAQGRHQVDPGLLTTARLRPR